MAQIHRRALIAAIPAALAMGAAWAQTNGWANPRLMPADMPFKGLDDVWVNGEYPPASERLKTAPSLVKVEFQIDVAKPSAGKQASLVFSLFDARFESAIGIGFWTTQANEGIDLKVWFDDFRAKKSRTVADLRGKFRRRNQLVLEVERPSMRQVVLKLGEFVWPFALDDLDNAFEPQRFTAQLHSIDGRIRFVDDPVT